MTEHVLVSPLGFAPGAVSGVYFALKEYQDLAVDKVITVGTGHDAVRDASAKLETLFRCVGNVTYKSCYIDATDLRGQERDASGPFAARMGLYVDRAHRAEQTVHVAVTGGRSGMGALAALAAQLYQADHLYHLWVHEEIERLGIIEARPDPQNRYINPTVEKGLCELVDLPFANLSGLVKDVQHSPTELSEHWVDLVGEKAPIALDTLTGYVPPGLSLRSARELLGLSEQWYFQEETPPAGQVDPYYRYEVGLSRLRSRIDQGHSRYVELLTYEQRLRENLTNVRLYGDTSDRRAERTEIIHHLNEIALFVLKEPFNDLCVSEPGLSQEQIWLRTLSILYSAGALDDTSRADLRDLMRDSIADPYSQQVLNETKESDDLGPFKWLAENKDGVSVLTDMLTACVTVGTFVLQAVTLWLKMGAP